MQAGARRLSLRAGAAQAVSRMARQVTMQLPMIVLTGLLAIGPARLEPEDAATGESQASAQAGRTGNPLWTVPLAELSATGERPIFAATRRPPQPKAVEPPATVAPQQSQAQPDRPALSLLGTVTEADGGRGIGIFTDDIARRALRLKVGEQHNGWAVKQVRRGLAVLEKDAAHVVLTLASPNTAPATAPTTATQPQPAAEAAATRPRAAAPTPVAAFDWTAILRQGEAGSR
jgi:general secretion pathway protein N